MGLALTGYAAFLIAGVTGVIYLAQERQLKAKRVARLPSLEALDRANLWALWIGFILFTLGVLHGLWLARAPLDQVGLTGRGGPIGWSDPKTVFTLATWGAYAVLLGIRTTALSRGPKVAALSILGLLLVGFTFLGVNQLFGTQHTFF